MSIRKVRRKDEKLFELNSGNIQSHQGTTTGRTSGLGFVINKIWKATIVETSRISKRNYKISKRRNKRIKQ